MAPTRVSGPRFSLLCFGFILCGVVTVLPGPMLPLLAARWGLRDVQSGAFFAAEFAASTVGAILSPHRLRQNLPLGYALMAAGILLLVLAGLTVEAAAGHGLALGAFALIGLGIGLSVTATNLHVADTAAEGRARRLSVANLWWGVGAVACPWMVAAAEHGDHLAILLLLLALGMAGVCAGLLPLLRPGLQAAQMRTERSSLRAEVGILAFFAGFLFLYVGVENAVGGWITTYAHRFSGMALADASLTVSLYWLALLAGRGAGSLALRSVPERAVLIPSLVLALLAVALLLAPHSTATLLAAVALAGAGFGPVFPIGISRMLGRLADHRNTGWAFAMCSGGGAVLPWLTGLVSTRSGSLRVGFAVPTAALALILLLALVENVALRSRSDVQTPRQRA